MTNENHDETLLFSPSPGGFRGESNLVVYYKMYTATHIKMRTLRNTESLCDNSLQNIYKRRIDIKEFCCISKHIQSRINIEFS